MVWSIYGARLILIRHRTVRIQKFGKWEKCFGTVFFLPLFIFLLFSFFFFFPSPLGYSLGGRVDIRFRACPWKDFAWFWTIVLFLPLFLSSSFCSIALCMSSWFPFFPSFFWCVVSTSSWIDCIQLTCTICHGRGMVNFFWVDQSIILQFFGKFGMIVSSWFSFLRFFLFLLLSFFFSCDTYVYVVWSFKKKFFFEVCVNMKWPSLFYALAFSLLLYDDSDIYFPKIQRWSNFESILTMSREFLLILFLHILALKAGIVAIFFFFLSAENYYVYLFLWENSDPSLCLSVSRSLYLVI